MHEFANRLADAGKQFLQGYSPNKDMRSWESYRDECHQLRQVVSDLRQRVAGLTQQIADLVKKED
jgi:hypothetical protein